MVDQPSPEFLKLLLGIDRQAILGGLSAGLTHVMNNVLGGVIGQIDLLIIIGGGVNLQKDLEQVIQICDDGVAFTKGISKVISAFQERNRIETNDSVGALTLLLSRIYRRAGLRAELKNSDVTPFAFHSELFVQVVFHLLSMAFEDDVKTHQSGDKNPIEVELKSDSQYIYLSINHISSVPSVVSQPASADSPEYRYWVVQKAAELSGATIAHKAEELACSLIWPVLGSTVFRKGA